MVLSESSKALSWFCHTSDVKVCSSLVVTVGMTVKYISVTQTVLKTEKDEIE